MTKSRIFKIIAYIALFELIVFTIFLIIQWDQFAVRRDKPSTTATSTPADKIIDTKEMEYIEVINGCGVHFEGKCAKVHRSPTSTSPVVANLRNKIVLRVASTTKDTTGQVWYKIAFDRVRYPERVTSDWYISENNARSFQNIGDQEMPYKTKIIGNTQSIVINITEQTLSAYNSGVLFMQTPISTGFDLTPSPLGEFSIFSKTPSRYMQGPQAGIDDYYDLPGVPWTMYFTTTGTAIHGAYWHNDFGRKFSHGCINLPPDQAEKLYKWAQLGTSVIIEK